MPQPSALPNGPRLEEHERMPSSAASALRQRSPMDIVVHDFSGHPFQMQLSRQLATIGHRVHHLYCGSLVGAKGDLTGRRSDPAQLSIRSLTTGRPIAKANLVRRFADEYRYGRMAAAHIGEIDPDVVLCANTPLDALLSIAERCARHAIPFVNWLQDINSLAAAEILPRKVPILGRLIARRYLALERRLLHRADHIVPISDDFDDYLQRIGILSSRRTTIENWAPLDELPMRRRRNAWSERYRLNRGRTVLYSGNLGFKQSPGLLIDLAKAMGESRPDDRLVVISQGMGAEWLAARQAELCLPNVLLLPFQHWSDLPDVMASADVLIALLESQKKPWCVPSKILSYCCAGRAIVLSADAGNLASRIVRQHRCGRVVAAGDGGAFIRVVLELLDDEPARLACAGNARRYAEAAFDIETIATRFEAVLERVVSEAT